MPYIAQDLRGPIDQHVNELKDAITNEGELNYAICRMILNYIDAKGKCYSTLNNIHGVLSCVDKEIYRRITAPYEDVKISENNDIL